jgi:predicted acetyltransferase
MPELIVPTAEWETAWRHAHSEWGPGLHEDGFGIEPDDDVESGEGFVAWLSRLTRESATSLPAPVGQVHCSYWWILDDQQVVGGIALRHELAVGREHLGHVGYGIRPSARGRGLATWALGRVLVEARRLGLARVLAVCAAGNAASAKTIERQGGVLEAVEARGPDTPMRYWITVSGDLRPGDH